MTLPSLVVYSVMRSSTNYRVNIRLVHMVLPPLVGGGAVTGEVAGEITEEPGGPGGGAQEDIECIVCWLALDVCCRLL